MSISSISMIIIVTTSIIIHDNTEASLDGSVSRFLVEMPAAQPDVKDRRSIYIYIYIYIYTYKYIYIYNTCVHI